MSTVGIDMKETIGMCVAAATAIALIILVVFAGANVSKREDEWEEELWRNR